MKITFKELQFVGVLALAGFLFSSRWWILFLDSLSPVKGLFVYYGILLVFLFLLSRNGLILWNFKINKPLQLLGLLLITFSFFVVVNWQNPYFNIVADGPPLESMSNIYFQSENGVIWSFWTQLLPSSDTSFLRVLTFIITPAALSLLGALLVEKKIEIL